MERRLQMPVTHAKNAVKLSLLQHKIQLHHLPSSISWPYDARLPVVVGHGPKNFGFPVAQVRFRGIVQGGHAFHNFFGQLAWAPIPSSSLRWHPRKERLPQEKQSVISCHCWSWYPRLILSLSIKATSTLYPDIVLSRWFEVHEQGPNLPIVPSQ